MDKNKLVEMPVWSRSTREEVIGVLWAILAAVASSPWVFIPAASMAIVSIAGSIYFAVAALRSHAPK